jgi:small conductance mechanosensitive channel
VYAAINVLAPLILPAYDTYFYLILLAVAGFFIVRLLSQLAYRVVADNSETQARGAKSVIVTAGYLAMVAVAVSIIAKNPTVTVVIGTVTGIILGVSMQSLIGNAIAGMVLAITRPFRIGDTITVFGSTGSVYEIGLLYTTLFTAEGKTVLAPNTSLLTTAIIKEKTAPAKASEAA